MYGLQSIGDLTLLVRGKLMFYLILFYNRQRVHEYNAMAISSLLKVTIDTVQ